MTTRTSRPAGAVNRPARTSFAVVTLLLGVCTTVAASAEQPSGAAPSTSTISAVVKAHPGVATGGHWFEGVGIVTKPVSTKATTISGQEAVEAFEDAVGLLGGEVSSSELVAATDGVFDVPGEPNRSTFVDRPSWLLSYQGTPADVRGPSTLADEQRAKIAASVTCTTYGLVDAETAAILEHFQLCQ